MFSIRANQENAIYEQQTAAASKPANQRLKGLAPKTPGNKAPKTPFKNDENIRLDFGKTSGKGRQDGQADDGKGGKAQRDAFQTPAGMSNHTQQRRDLADQTNDASIGPRARAPLGQKTTNAKAGAFRPAPNAAAPKDQQPRSAKHQSPRHRRGLIKVLEAKVENEEDEEAHLPEIEHMPPRGIPLPDHPDDVWPIDRTYPQLEGANFTRGWFSEFSSKHQDSDDERDGLSDFEQKLRELETKSLKEAERAAAGKASKPATRKPALQKTARDPLTASHAPSTRKSRSAASSLSQPASRTPSFAAPTAATKARGHMATKRPMASSATTANSRHTVARAASNNTLGYSKGRAVSGAARKPLSGIVGEESVGGTAAAPFAGGTTLDKLLGLNLGGSGGEDEAGDDDDLGLGKRFAGENSDEKEKGAVAHEESFQLDEVVFD